MLPDTFVTTSSCGCGRAAVRGDVLGGRRPDAAVTPTRRKTAQCGPPSLGDAADAARATARADWTAKRTLASGSVPPPPIRPGLNAAGRAPDDAQHADGRCCCRSRRRRSRERDECRPVGDVVAGPRTLGAAAQLGLRKTSAVPPESAKTHRGDSRPDEDLRSPSTMRAWRLVAPGVVGWAGLYGCSEGGRYCPSSA
jgi:hypothetical protein